MSSCFYGSGRTTYRIDLDITKSPSTSVLTTNSSSPSSTISETSNSILAISTRKPRTPRKRPNQTYNEAATLLSTAYPNIFSANDSSKPCKFIKPSEYSSFSFEESSSELLLPFPVEKPAFQFDQTAHDKPCSIHIDEISCQTNFSDIQEGFEDFDTESILDEEIEEGVIDCIMGNTSAFPEEYSTNIHNGGVAPVNFCYGYPVELGLGLWFGGRFDFTFDMMRGGVANGIRQNDGNWWAFPTVNVGEICPRYNPVLSSPEKKKVVEKTIPSKSHTSLSEEKSVQTTKSKTGLLLKLNFDGVMNAWSDRGSPFSEDIDDPEFSGSDALEILSEIDLFGENGGVREASVQRYKEKRRTRLFSKKIRYQVRKVNADQRPRMKGRFVRSNSSGR